MVGDAAPDDALAARIAAELDRIAPASGPLGVAVSGGGDSVALLLVAHDWAAARGRGLAVATVDHGLRAESAAEAAQVARLAAALGLGHDVLRPGVGPGNVNAAARAARYAALAGWARGAGLAGVLLGHTLDDQAETVLMRLGRGAGADGLSGMAARAERLGTLWLRPLLGLRRAALRGFLRARGTGWIEDPTNEDPSHQRVRLRALSGLLAEAGVPPEAIAASAARLARQAEVLGDAVAALAARALRPVRCGTVVLDPGALAEARRETALSLLARAVQVITGAGYPPRGEALARALDAVAATPPAGVTLAGVLLRPVRGGGVLLCREPAAMTGEVQTGPEGAVWDARWALSPEFAATLPAGAALGPLGPDDASALAPELRPACWNALPHTARQGLPAIRAEGRVIAVPVAPDAADPATEGSDSGAFARDLARLRLRRLTGSA